MPDLLYLYDPANWYWIVGGDESHWWSSASSSYVSPLQSWLEVGNLPTRIANERELTDVLAPYGLKGPFVSTDPADHPLTMRQLRLALLTLGSQPVDFVASVIAKIPDATQRGIATIWYEETVDGITWDNPETQFLIAASGLPLDQASALWLKAKDL